MSPWIPSAPDAERLALYRRIRNHTAFNACSMIDWANNKPENRGKKPKVGGHQASSLSAVDLLSALYLHFKRPQDRIAVKPHAAPVLYSLAYLMGLMTQEQMGQLREFGGPQPYPTEPKERRLVDYTTGSEALGVCGTIYDAYGAKYQNDNLERLGAGAVDSVYYAHCGDGELTEGQIDESLYDAGRWQLSNLVWIVDLNLQSLDRVLDDSQNLENWVASKFAGHGWHVIRLRWGSRMEGTFQASNSGRALRQRLESLSDVQFHTLLLVEPAVARRLLLGKKGAEDPSMQRLEELFLLEAPARAETLAGAEKALEGVQDHELMDLLQDVGGHDLNQLIQGVEEALAVVNRPVVLLARTIKGKDSALAAHPENHGMLMSSEDLEEMRGRLEVDSGRFPSFSPESVESRFLGERAKKCFDLSQEYQAAPVQLELDDVRASQRKSQSTGEAFQSLNLALLRSNAGPYLQFGAPDVGQTTHLGPVIRQTGVYSPVKRSDYFQFLTEQRKSAFAWRSVREGQFHSFAIAEGNAMLWAWAFGRPKRPAEGRIPFLTVVTVYDKFFERALNQLDYACYSEARFIAVGTPSGTGLSRETGSHQSAYTPRILMDLPGILTFEPAFAVDVEAIYTWAMSQLWNPEGEAVYLRLTTQAFEQPEPAEGAKSGAIAGAYWVRHPALAGAAPSGYEPGRNVVHLFATGRMVPVALQAAEELAEEGIHACVLNVTSWERLWREWDHWRSHPELWEDPEASYRIIELVPASEVNVPLIIAGDFCPSVCEWVSSALQRLGDHRFLGPRKNSQAGDLESLDAYHGTGVQNLVHAAKAELEWQLKSQ